MYRVIHIKDPITKAKKYGIEGYDIINGIQSYPYDEYEQAANNARFLKLKDQNPDYSRMNLSKLEELDELQGRT